MFKRMWKFCTNLSSTFWKSSIILSVCLIGETIAYILQLTTGELSQMVAMRDVMVLFMWLGMIGLLTSETNLTMLGLGGLSVLMFKTFAEVINTTYMIVNQQHFLVKCRDPIYKSQNDTYCIATTISLILCKLIYGAFLTIVNVFVYDHWCHLLDKEEKESQKQQ